MGNVIAALVTKIVTKISGQAVAWLWRKFGKFFRKKKVKSERKKIIKRMDKAVERHDNEEPNDEAAIKEVIDSARELFRSGQRRR